MELEEMEIVQMLGKQSKIHTLFMKKNGNGTKAAKRESMHAVVWSGAEWSPTGP